MKTQRIMGSLLCTLLGVAACGNVPVGAPAELTVEGGQLRWSVAAENASALRLERKSGTGRFETLTTLAVDAVQYQDSTATTPGTTYSYRLLAMNGTDPWSGTYSHQASFTVP